MKRGIESLGMTRVFDVIRESKFHRERCGVFPSKSVVKKTVGDSISHQLLIGLKESTRSADGLMKSTKSAVCFELMV